MTGHLEDARQSNLEGLRIIREAGAMPDVVGCLADVVLWLHMAGADERARDAWMTAEQLALQHGIRAEVAWPLTQARKELGNGEPPTAISAESAGVGSVTVEQALDAAEHDLETTPVRLAEPGEAGRSRFDLTPREREVLQLVVAGQTNAEIGDALFISRKTASVHVANIKDKLAADSRVGIVTIALDQGLVSRGGVQ
jgi:DNA-binding CsgD family transcriptional regulator